MTPQEWNEARELLAIPQLVGSASNALLLTEVPAEEEGETPFLEIYDARARRVVVRTEGPETSRLRLDSPETGVHRGQWVTAPGTYHVFLEGPAFPIPTGSANLHVGSRGLSACHPWGSVPVEKPSLKVQPARLDLVTQDKQTLELEFTTRNGGMLVVELTPRPLLLEVLAGPQRRALTVERGQLPYGVTGELRMRLLVESPWLNRRGCTVRVPYEKTELYCFPPVLRLPADEERTVSFWRSDGVDPELSWDECGLEVKRSGPRSLTFRGHVSPLMCRVTERSGLAAHLKILPEGVL